MNANLITTFNLDDENEVNEFIATYGTLKGISLAHRLGDSGKGCKERANSLSAYAWNKHTAMACRKEGKIAIALQYEAICERIYASMDENIKW